MSRKKAAAALVLAASIAGAPLTCGVHAVHAEDDPAWEKKDETDTYQDPPDASKTGKETEYIGEISKGADPKLNAKKTTGKASNANDGPKGAGKHVSTSGGSATWSSGSSASISDGSLAGETKKAIDQSSSSKKSTEGSKNASPSGSSFAGKTSGKTSAAGGSSGRSPAKTSEQAKRSSLAASSGASSLASGSSLKTGSSHASQAGTDQITAIMKKLIMDDSSLVDASSLRKILPFPSSAGTQSPAATDGLLKKGLLGGAYTEEALNRLTAIKESTSDAGRITSGISGADEKASEKAAAEKKARMAAFVKTSRKIFLLAAVPAVIAVSAAIAYAVQLYRERKKKA